MEMTIYPPAARLQGQVAALWTLRGQTSGRYTGLPKPYAELIFSLSGQHRWYAAPDTHALNFDHGWLTPVQAGPRFAETSGMLDLVGARLRPDACVKMFGAASICEPATPIPLEALLGSEAQLLRERLYHSRVPGERVRILADWIGRRLSSSAPARLPDEVWLNRMQWRVDALADAMGLSPRGLHKRFVTQFGIGPKLWLQLGRFDAVLRAAPRSRSLADLAAEMGYADQAHMAVEFQRFAGSAPGAYGRRRERAAIPGNAPHFLPGSDEVPKSTSHAWK